MGDVVLSAQHRQISIFPIPTFKFQKQPKLGAMIKREDPSREQTTKSHCDES